MNLHETRLNRIAEIFADIAQVIFASVVIPFAIDKSNQTMLIWGLVLSLLFWFLSILFTKQKS